MIVHDQTAHGRPVTALNFREEAGDFFPPIRKNARLGDPHGMQPVIDRADGARMFDIAAASGEALAAIDALRPDQQAMIDAYVAAQAGS